MSKCETCLDGRAIISESGIHYICTLTDKEVLECLTREKDHYIRNPMKKDSTDDRSGT